MASDEIRVNPNALRKNATAFDRSADTANGIAGRLRGGVHRLDPTNYGDDDTGEAFQKEYVQSRDQLVQGIDGIVAMIRAVAEGVRMTADAYQQADDVVRGVGPGSSAPSSTKPKSLTAETDGSDGKSKNTPKSPGR